MINCTFFPQKYSNCYRMFPKLTIQIYKKKQKKTPDTCYIKYQKRRKMVLFTSFQRSNSNNKQSMCFQNLGPKHVASTPSASTSSRCTWIMTMNMVVTTSEWKKYSSATWLFLWLAGSLDKVCLEGHVELQWNFKQCVFQQVYLQLHLHVLKLPF